MLTKARINKAIAHTKLRVVGNGDGYFYFVDVETNYQHGMNVPVNRLNHQSLEQWVLDAEQARKSNIIKGFREDGILQHDLGGFEDL